MVELANGENPRFSIMLAQDYVPTISDHDLEPLRTAETAVIPKRRQHNFTQGEMVRVPSGIFSGMTGEVSKSLRGRTWVLFGGTPIEFPTSFLRQSVPLEALAA
jgi:hypothetical protein